MNVISRQRRQPSERNNHEAPAQHRTSRSAARRLGPAARSIRRYRRRGDRRIMRLRIFHDDLTTPTGKALVRVVQASMKHPQVTVSWGGETIAGKLA
jgi:hypothetical protein